MGYISKYTKQCIFHYCSLDTFAKIMESKKLRMYDQTNFNDSFEIKWVFSNICDELIQAYDSNPFEIKETDGTVLSLKNMANEALYFLVDRPFSDLVYSTCFSQNGDLLSQWRAYADDGKGVAIGFDLELFKKETEGIFGFQPLRLKKITYLNKQEALNNAFITQAINTALQNIKKAIEEKVINPTQKYSIIKSFIFRVILDTLIESAFYKNPAFSEEQEWRLIVNDVFNKECDFFSTPNSSKEQDLSTIIEIRSGRVYSYKRFSFEHLIARGFIKCVIVGPTSPIENKADIVNLCKHYGVDIQVQQIDFSIASYKGKQ